MVNRCSGRERRRRKGWEVWLWVDRRSRANKANKGSRLSRGKVGQTQIGQSIIGRRCINPFCRPFFRRFISYRKSQKFQINRGYVYIQTTLLFFLPNPFSIDDAADLVTVCVMGFVDTLSFVLVLPRQTCWWLISHALRCSAFRYIVCS
jgi:hypothetical protein